MACTNLLLWVGKGGNVKAFGYSILGLLLSFYVVDSEKTNPRK